MSENLLKTFIFMRRIGEAATIGGKRDFAGFFASRLVQSLTEPTLLLAMERMIKGVGAQVENIGPSALIGMTVAAASDESADILQWLRAHTNVAAMICSLKNDSEIKEAVATITLTKSATSTFSPLALPTFTVPITAKLRAPLAHGSDTKAGNATLFRRRQLLSQDGSVVSVPFYAGNALRGQMRDLLADHFLAALALSPRRDKPPVNLWFFHAIYAGGVLEEGTNVTAKVEKEFGSNGALRTDGIRLFRDHLPGLSALGAAIGNKVLPGRLCVGDLRPRCKEWGSGPSPAAELMHWEFLTRRDDYEGKGEDSKHAGMIANVECLREGVILDGGLDIDSHAAELERSAIGLGLSLLADRGMLGAENRRGLGKCAIEITGAPDQAPYVAHLAEKRHEILAYLEHIGATNAPGATHLLGA